MAVVAVPSKMSLRSWGAFRIYYCFLKKMIFHLSTKFVSDDEKTVLQKLDVIVEVKIYFALARATSSGPPHPGCVE